jgi:uncharacterized protein (TIGR02677 family)
LLEGFSEFNYLSAQKVGVYRHILRFFYEQHLMQRTTFSPEDICQHLLEMGIETDLEQTVMDLESLIGWGNLDKRRDQSRVSTLADYARKRNLYFAKPRALRIEAFLKDGLELPEDTVVSPLGAISAMEGYLQQLQQMLESGVEAEEIELLWNNNIYLPFVRLATEVRGLVANLERKLTLEEREGFLEFKDVVRGFLERLSRELSGAGRRVGEVLSNFVHLESLVLTIGRVRSGRLTVSVAALSQAATTTKARQEFSAMHGWFTRAAFEGDGLEYAISALRSAVTRVLTFIDALHRTRELGLGRAGVFVQLAADLELLQDPTQARAKLAQTLGLNAPLHAIGDALQASAPAWQTALEAVEVFPVKLGRTKAHETAELRQTSSEAKAAASAAQLAFRSRQERLLELFTARGGELVLDGLELPDIESLYDLMGYLERAQQGMTAGPAGHLLEVVLSEQPAELHGVDWALVLERGATLRLVGDA